MIRADVSFQFKERPHTFLVITGSIASQLEDFSCKVLKDGSEIDCTRISNEFHPWLGEGDIPGAPAPTRWA